MTVTSEPATNQATVAPFPRRYDAWASARKRARHYLNLHRIPEGDCEQLLQQASQYLPAKPPLAEQEQIRLFIQALQKAAPQLAATQSATPAIGCPYAEALQALANGRAAGWLAHTSRQTGPRVERSSIRVAPLQAISLRLLPRQTKTSH